MNETTKQEIEFEVYCRLSEVKELTKYNNHAEAALLGAELLRHEQLIKVFRYIKTLRDRRGYMPMNLSKYAYKKLNEMRDYAEKILPADLSKEFYGAF